jgi:hypothetical protein
MQAVTAAAAAFSLPHLLPLQLLLVVVADVEGEATVCHQLACLVLLWQMLWQLWAHCLQLLQVSCRGLLSCCCSMRCCGTQHLQAHIAPTAGTTLKTLRDGLGACDSGSCSCSLYDGEGTVMTTWAVEL